MIEQVLRLAERGFLLFPCRPQRKEPAVEWRKRATHNPKTLTRWAQKIADSNWAIACGRASGVFCVDVDGEAGLTAFCAWLREHGEMDTFETLGVKTPRGAHLYFRYPERGTVRNSQSKLAPGIDIRGDGGYVLVPPSIHPSGEAYRWLCENEDAPISYAPPWLMDSLKRRTPAERKTA